MPLFHDRTFLFFSLLLQSWDHRPITPLICYLFTFAPPSSFIILPPHDMQATFWYSSLSSEVTCPESSFQVQLASLVLLYQIILFYCLDSDTTVWNYLVQLFVYCLLWKWNLHKNRTVLFTTESIMPRIVTGTESVFNKNMQNSLLCLYSLWDIDDRKASTHTKKWKYVSQLFQQGWSAAISTPQLSCL